MHALLHRASPDGIRRYRVALSAERRQALSRARSDQQQDVHGAGCRAYAQAEPQCASKTRTHTHTQHVCSEAAAATRHHPHEHVALFAPWMTSPSMRIALSPTRSRRPPPPDLSHIDAMTIKTTRQTSWVRLPQLLHPRTLSVSPSSSHHDDACQDHATRGEGSGPTRPHYDR